MNRGSEGVSTGEDGSLYTLRAERRVFGIRFALMNYVRSLFRLKPIAEGKTFRVYPGQDIKIPVYARYGTSDFRVFQTVFLSREFHPLRQMQDVKLIVDAGANVGYTAILFCHMFPNAAIIAVEPDPGNFAILKMNTEPYRDRVRVIQAGLWGKPSRMTFTQSDYRGGDMWAKRAVASDSAEGSIQCITLESLLKETSADAIDILKLDIEGAEVSVFENATPWISRVRCVSVELHDDTELGSATEAFDSLFSESNYNILHSGEKKIAVIKLSKN